MNGEMKVLGILLTPTGKLLLLIEEVAHVLGSEK